MATEKNLQVSGPVLGGNGRVDGMRVCAQANGQLLGSYQNGNVGFRFEVILCQERMRVSFSADA